MMALGGIAPMGTARQVIDRFGGQAALARLIGKRLSVVAYWAKTGTIPAKWHPVLLRAAEGNGLVLTASDLVVGEWGGRAGAEGTADAGSADDDLADDAAAGESGLPEARYKGFLAFAEHEVPCYVLDDGQRVIGRTSATEMLTGIKGGGGLEKYLGVVALRSHIDPESMSSRMVAFRLPEVQGLNRRVKGLPADLLIEVCRGFMAALEASTNGSGPPLTPTQMRMAIKAGMFVASCAKLGLDALIDEATGYQYERAEDALQVKLKAYLEDEMRPWEKTFPDELWREFARLTHWKGSVTQRPKYWGKLVMELVYENLDKDVADWLRNNAPKPRGGQNYHQWLSGQYGLKRLVEHIWMVVGMASACSSMLELRQKVGERFGRRPVQLTFLDAPAAVAGLAGRESGNHDGSRGPGKHDKGTVRHAEPRALP